MYLDINWDDIYASCSNMSHFYWGQVSLRRLQNHVQPSSGMIRVSENSTQETARNSFIPNKSYEHYIQASMVTMTTGLVLNTLRMFETGNKTSRICFCTTLIRYQCQFVHTEPDR